MPAPTPHPYSVVNAFAIAGIPFSGNPAGVVANADELDDATKQNIARQLNLVDTTFICKSDRADFRFRYFTPQKELPVTGHPTVAALGALLDTGILASNAKVRIETVGGDINAWLDDGRIWVHQPPAVFRPLRCGVGELADAIGLVAGDIFSSPVPEVSNVGLGHIIAMIKDVETLRRARTDIEKLTQVCTVSGAREAQIFAVDTDGAIHTRNLCPRTGEEDPACGNGNAAVGAWMAKHGQLNLGQRLSLSQGAVVNRPSCVHIERQVDFGDQISIAVGGIARLMAEGCLYL
jgi:trans-2,3-dihydro-3-hydroxyanthranilate isomerase